MGEEGCAPHCDGCRPEGPEGRGHFFLVALFDRLFETDLIEKCCVDGRFG